MKTTMNLAFLISIISCAQSELDDTQESMYPSDENSSEGFEKLFQIFKKNKGSIKELYYISPDIKRTSAEIIVSRGFQSEGHTVVTDDGYILGMFRIINPYLKPSDRLKPILIWHQLMGNSNQWLISTPGFIDSYGRYYEGNGTVPNNCRDRLTSNLAFTLAACGYDVWLGNVRGNRYSSGHVSLPPYGTLYSNYTYTQLGVYDVRNSIEYIMKKTGTSCIGYIGSSQGTTNMIVLLSLIPKFEKHLAPIIMIPPVAFLGNTTSISRLATPLVPILNNVVASLGIPLIVGEAIAQICSAPSIQPICAAIIRLSFENVPSYLTELSTWVGYYAVLGGNFFGSQPLLQYGQYILDGRFHEFDYLNPTQNYQAYGQPVAPNYPVENIISKNLVLFRAPNDAFAVRGDVDHLVSSLTVSPLDYYVVPQPTYNHGDFIFATKNNRYINWRILAHLRRRDHAQNSKQLEKFDLDQYLPTED